MKSVKSLFILLMFLAQNVIGSDFPERSITEELEPITSVTIGLILDYLPRPALLIGTGFLLWCNATHKDKGVIYTALGLTTLGFIKFLSTPGSATDLLTATPGDALVALEDYVVGGAILVSNSISNLYEFLSRQSLTGMIVMGTGLTFAGSLFTSQVGHDPNGGGGFVLGGIKFMFIPISLAVAGTGILIMVAKQRDIIHLGPLNCITDIFS